MESTTPATDTPKEARLPLPIIDRATASGPVPARPWLQRHRVGLVLVLGFSLAGAALWIGTPWATGSNAKANGGPHAVAARNRVVALGRLTPSGELRSLAAPFGAGDARVAEVRVKEGEQVAAGTALAVFDSAPALEATLKVAEQQLGSRRAALAQAERAVAFSQTESAAAQARADVALRAAEIEYQRWAGLVDQGFVSPAAIDQRRTLRDEAAQEQRRASATRARHAGQGAEQPDLQVARRAVEVALAERDRAATDLDRATLRAPADGTVIAIHVQPGERPGSAGVLDFGDTRVMTAELELYQADVAGVHAGQRVSMRSPALSEPLTGHISRIGLSVGRQRLTDTSPAANIDARVVLATVTLDDASSARARRLVGLEVLAHIETGTP